MDFIILTGLMIANDCDSSSDIVMEEKLCIGAA